VQIFSSDLPKLPVRRNSDPGYRLPNTELKLARRVLELDWEEFMLTVNIEEVGEMTVVECIGRIVRSESSLKLREAVTSQLDARIIVVDLSEVTAIEGGGLGMLVVLLAMEFRSAHSIQVVQSHTIRAQQVGARHPDPRVRHCYASRNGGSPGACTE
jgi:anti-anti-sigma regulatory factor